MENNDDIMFGDKSLDEWTNDYPVQGETVLSEDEAEERGLLQPEPTQEAEPQEQTADNNVEQPQEERQYKKLGVWDTIKDINWAMETEASRLLLPKEGSWLAEKTGLSEKLVEYEPQTRLAEASKYLYRYGAGTLGFLGSFLFGAGEAAVAGKAIQGAAVATNVVKTGAAIEKFGVGLQKLLTASNIIKTGDKANKLTKGLAWLGNKAIEGAIPAAMADFTLFRQEEEGQFADVFGVTDNPIVTLLQTDENDSEFESRLKNTVQGFMLGIPFAIGFSALSGAFRNCIKSGKKAINAQTAEEAAEALAEGITAEQNLKQVLETSELADRVKNIYAEAEGKGIDAEQVILDTFNPKQYDDAKEMLKLYKNGEEPFVHSDGTWDITISNYEDAYRVEPEEYAKQMAETGQGLSQQNKAIQDTWIDRGWIGENEKLTKANANKIVKRYLDKFQIDNKIDVEFVDGLKVDGKKVDGNTEQTTYQKKGTKSNKLSTITVQIDKNAEYPFATLRMELEHARDYAKNTVPDNAKIEGSGTHFSRYTGDNEAEVAPQYTYKKSMRKAGQNPSSQNFMNTLNNEENVVKYNQGDNINGQRTTKDRFNNTETSTNGLYGTRPSESSEGISGTDIRRSYDSSSNNGLIIHSPNEEFKKALEAEGKPINNYKELAVSDEGAASFISDFRAANEVNGKLAAQVYEYPLEEYKQMKLYTAENGKSGFAIKKDGDIVSVFSAEKGSLKGLMNLAIQNGGKKLDCFDTFLPKIYKKFGFEEVNRVKWNEEYKPKNWDKEFFKQYNNGEPDVVYMELKRETQSQTPQQLHLDFSTPEEATAKIASGEVIPKTLKEADEVISKMADIDVEISGTDWQAYAKDADKIPTEIKDLIDLEDLKLFFNEDGSELAVISRKELAVAKIHSQLLDKMKEAGENPPVEIKKQLIDGLTWTDKYINAIASEKGRGLNEQKFVNKALDLFGKVRSTARDEEGIHNFIDILDTIVKKENLNFTKGNLQQNKEIAYKALAEMNPDLMYSLAESPEFSKQLDEIITEVCKNPKPDLKKLEAKLLDAMTIDEYSALWKAQLEAPTKKGRWETIKNWSNANGGIASYYVHNLLSGAGTLFKNVTSGGMNTLYFPARKMLAGLLDPMLSSSQKGALYREGINTYKNLVASWSESWQLAKQAFITGEGKLNSIAQDTLNMGESFRGFNEWGQDKSFLDTIQNLHSVMTRLTGASDEFMSQLNYRSIARAKALEAADNLAQKAGKLNNEAWINEQAEKIFKTFFTSDGKPMDGKVFNEAKTMLYQNPLSNKMFDPRRNNFFDTRTGELLGKNEQATQTFASKLGGNLQSYANENLLAKFFFPFVKTGTNILQMNLDHNLIYSLFSPAQRKVLASNTTEGALARAQTAMGIASFGLASLLALNGAITGSMPSDAKERKALLATGWRPYSFKVGNNYVSYQGYEPLHTMLGFAADSMNLLHSISNRTDEDTAMKYLMQGASVIVNNFLDKAAFRTGLQSFSALMELDERHIADWQKSMAQIGQGLLPDVSMIKNISSIGNREAKSPKTLTERLFNTYFNRGLGEYRRDAFGDKQNIFNAIISTASSQEEGAEYEELARLAELGYKPTEISETISGYNLNYHNFTDEKGRTAYDYMMEELSKTDLKQEVRDLVTSDWYKELPDGVNDMSAKSEGFKWDKSDDTKVNAINDLFIEYNDIAKEKVLYEHPELKDKKGRTIQEAESEAEVNKMNKQLQNSMSESAQKMTSLF